MNGILKQQKEEQKYYDVIQEMVNPHAPKTI